MTPQEITHVIYHANCFDGFAAAWSAWLMHDDKIKYLPTKYGDPVPELPIDAKVMIADFSFPKQQLLELKSKVADLIVLDHHKTAQADLEGLDFAHFDMNKSGARLAFEWLYQEFDLSADSLMQKVRDIILYVEDRDLWKFELHLSKLVNAALGSYQRDFDTWKEIAYSGITRLSKEGEIVLRQQDVQIQSMLKNVRWALIGKGGHVVPVVNASVLFSDVANRLAAMYPDAAFAAYYFDTGDGSRQWGLRSVNGFDVSFVAEQYGGGGHQAAAGFSTQTPFPLLA